MFGGGGGDFFVIGVVVFLGMVVRALNSGLEWGCDWGCCNFGGGGDDLVGDDDIIYRLRKFSTRVRLEF